VKRRTATTSAARAMQRLRAKEREAGYVRVLLKLPLYARGAFTIAARELCGVAEADQIGVIVGYRTRAGRSKLFKL